MKRTPLIRKTRLKSRVGFKVGVLGNKIAQVKRNSDTLTYSTFQKSNGLKRNIKPRKKKTTAQRKKYLWELCKKITRARYINKDGTWTCYTSGKVLTPDCLYDVQTGHGKPKGALPLQFQYDLRNLRIQSLNANKNNGGETDIFIAKLEKEPEGLAFLQESCRYIDGQWKIRHDFPKMGSADAREFVERLIVEYEEILSHYV